VKAKKDDRKGNSMTATMQKSLLLLGTTILTLQVFLPLGTVYAGTTEMQEERQEQVEIPTMKNYMEMEETSDPRFFFTRSHMQGTVDEPLKVTFSSDQEVSEVSITLPKEAQLVKDQLQSGVRIVQEEQSNQCIVHADRAQKTFVLPIVFAFVGRYELALQDNSVVIEIIEKEITNGFETCKDSNLEKSKIEDETNISQEIEDNQIYTARNGTWGTVSWTWESSTRTITLQGGTAGSVESAPWKKHTNVVKIEVRDRVVLPSNLFYLFSGLLYLERIEQGENFDTSNVTSMFAMFEDTSSLTTLDVSNWDTSNVNNMTQMFNGASSLTTLDVSKWNTSNVTSMTQMFNGANSLTTLDVSKWNTSNVTNMAFMFQNTNSLTTLDVSNWDTSNITSMFSMFQNTSSLTMLDVSNWDTSNVNNMTQMFNGASSLAILDPSDWNTSNVTSMLSMFQNTSSLTTLDVSNWDTSNVTNMALMFQNTSSLATLDVSDWETSNATSMFAMFEDTSSLTTLDVSNWDTSNVNNMTQMFNGASSLTTLDVSNWDTSNVKSMFAMFQNTSSLTTLDVSNWDTSNVNIMTQMFNGTSSLTKLDVSNWDTSNVTNMALMFQNTSSLATLDVSNWDTSNVNNMTQMFNGASCLTMLNVSNWNTTNVSEATSMFSNTINLSELHLGTRSRFDHLASPPTMPTITSSDNYTGSWVYYLNQENTIPEAYITSSPANFWREYDGSNPGTYQWQKKGSVVVHYRDINDQEVITSEILTGGIREIFQIEEKAIEGYTLQEILGKTSGRFTEEEQLIIFRYMKDTVGPVDPLNPEIEVDPENKPELPENQGLLSIDFVSSFNFGAQVISTQDQTYYAQPQRLLNEDGTVNESEERPNYVQISDRRSENERNGWQLAVTQKEQFRGEEKQELFGASLSLSNQQVITAQGGTAPGLQSVPCVLIPGNRRTLLKAQGNEGTGTWIYRFGDADKQGESVALNVPKGATPEATTYSTTLIWELSAVPKN